jgi:hypothetical protein
MLIVRRMRKGELRAFIGDRPLAGVKGVSLECIGFGRTDVVVKLAGAEIRLDDEAGPET